MIDQLKSQIDEQSGGSPASASPAIDQAQTWKVPVLLSSWQTSGKRKQVVLEWTVFATSPERAAEIVHSMAGRLVGQTLVTAERFERRKTTTNRFEVYKIKVKKEEITMVERDFQNESNELSDTSILDNQSEAAATLQEGREG